MNSEVIQALAQLEKERGIPREALLEAIEVALVSAFKRNYGSSQNVRVKIDPDTGEINVYAHRNVVETPRDPRQEISLEEARAIDPRHEPGDVFEVEVTPREFGRIAAQTAKQVVVQKIREAERGIIYEEYSSREGEVVTGVVQRRELRNVIVDLGRVEAVMPPSEQVARENYAFGDRIKVYIVEARKTPKGPQVIVSRSHPMLLKRLLELEVPEVYEGVVEIKGIAREAGNRSKVAVLSYDQNVDAVGACVGPRGMRVQKIVAELRGEKIDIIQWHDDPGIYVSNALSPARVILTRVDEEARVARAIVPDNQLSLAIGKEGQNARLAAKLTGWKIDIKSDSQVRALEEEEERLAAEKAAAAQAEAVRAASEEGAWVAGAAAPAEAVSASRSEAETEAEPETGVQAEHEAGREAGIEVGPEVEPEVEPGLETESVTGGAGDALQDLATLGTEPEAVAAKPVEPVTSGEPAEAGSDPGAGAPPAPKKKKAKGKREEKDADMPARKVKGTGSRKVKRVELGGELDDELDI